MHIKLKYLTFIKFLRFLATETQRTQRVSVFFASFLKNTIFDFFGVAKNSKLFHNFFKNLRNIRFASVSYFKTLVSLCPRWLIFLIFVLNLINQVFSDDWWNTDFKFRRKVQFQGIQQKYPESDGGRIIITVPGRAFDDGRDIRIVDVKGDVLKHQVIWADESDTCEIICELKSEEIVYVYWGNNACSKLKNEEIYDPKFGLILETLEKPEGNFNTWEEISDLIERSKKIYGRSVHPKVFDGFNPFGPSDNYISHYSGWLNCPEKGLYTFYTVSDDASVLMLHEKIIVQWTGVHTAGGGVYGEHAGQVNLKSGVYKFDYYHVESTYSQACVAGWRLPSKFNSENKYEGIEVIAEEHFSGFREGSVENLEELDQDFSVDFKFFAVTDLYINDNDSLVKVNFAEQVRGKKNIIDNCAFNWDFSDGNTDSGRTVSHTFLTSGIYKITLTLNNQKKIFKSLQMKIKITPIWAQSSQVTKKTSELFFESIKNYDLEKLSFGALNNFYIVADSVNNYEGKLRVLRILLKTPEKISKPECFQKFIELATLEAYISKNEKESDAAFKQAEKFHDDFSKISLKLKSAEIKFKVFDKIADARAILATIEEVLGFLPNSQKKEFYLISGDLERMTGDLKKAREFYNSVSSTDKSNSDIGDIQLADWRMRIVAFILSDDADAALELVNNWKNAQPASYIDTDLAYLEVKALLANKKTMEAEIQAKIFITGQPSNNLTPDVLFELGAYFAGNNEPEKAKAYLTLLVQKYKENPKSAEGLKILNKIK